MSSQTVNKTTSLSVHCLLTAPVCQNRIDRKITPEVQSALLSRFTYERIRVTVASLPYYSTNQDYIPLVLDGGRGLGGGIFNEIIFPCLKISSVVELSLLTVLSMSKSLEASMRVTKI